VRAASSPHAELDGGVRQRQISLYIHVYIGTIEAADIWRQALTENAMTALRELFVALRILIDIFFQISRWPES